MQSNPSVPDVWTVVEQSKAAYSVLGSEPQVKPLSDLGVPIDGFVLFEPTSNLVEFLLAESGLEDSPELDASMREYSDRGMEVLAITPLHTLGEAHSRFFGIASRVQGYWASEPNRIFFGRPERP